MVNSTQIFGMFFVLLSYMIFILFSYWIVISKIQSDDTKSNYQILNLLKSDKHYCLVLPLLIPFSIIVFYNRYIHYNIFRRV